MSLPAYESSRGNEAIALAREIAGIKLDPWQELSLEVGLGEQPNGKWAAFEVAEVVARQNGKNEIAIVRELAGLFLFGEKLLIHSAHEFKTSTEHQRRLEAIIQDTPEFHKRVKPRGYRHSHGEEGIELRTGQRVRFMTRTKGGGRGHSGDVVVFDEAMILSAAFVGALMPIVSAKSVHGNPQLWYFGNAVDQHLHDGVVLARLRERALAGGDPSLAYLEWSVDADGPDGIEEAAARSPEVWAQANPALGLRISAEHIANEQRSMTGRTFAVERLSVGDWPMTDDSVGGVLDLEQWKTLTDEKSEPVGEVSYALDVSPDRAWASIAAAGKREDGLAHVEVGERRRGTAWVAKRVAELTDRIVLDGAGPAGTLILKLEDLGVEVVTVTAQEYANACGLIFDLVEQDGLRHLGDQALTAAVKGATSRPLGEKWAWSRKNSAVDITPLVSVTLALWDSDVQVERGSVYDRRGIVEV